MALAFFIFVWCAASCLLDNTGGKSLGTLFALAWLLFLLNLFPSRYISSSYISLFLMGLRD